MKQEKSANLINIYMASIYQNAGKTTISLGLYNAFRERGIKTAFLKPVGQQAVAVADQEIDKDSYLMGEVFHIHKRLKDMSPVTIPRGFTEKYIFEPKRDVLVNKIKKAYTNLIQTKSAIIIEGTGHAAVGSVVDLSNADVASLLGSKVIIISEGGIGRSIDEIMLNKALFDLKQVEVIGVIINKVLPEKYNRIKQVLSQGLKNKGLKLLGLIPRDPILSEPRVEDLINIFKLELLCGKENLDRRIRNTIVAAMEPENMVDYIKDGTLILTSGDRVDNIMVAVSSHMIMQGRHSQISGMILSGGLKPDEKILELLKKSGIPVLIAKEDIFTIAGQMEGLSCKIQKSDQEKIQEAVQLVRTHVDIDSILEHFRSR